MMVRWCQSAFINQWNVQMSLSNKNKSTYIFINCQKVIGGAGQSWSIITKSITASWINIHQCPLLFNCIILQIETLPEAQRTQGIDSLTWVATYIGSKFGQLYVVPLVLVQNLTTRWCHQNWFQMWPTCYAISIGSNFVHQVVLLALVTQLTTRWRNLH